MSKEWRIHDWEYNCAGLETGGQVEDKHAFDTCLPKKDVFNVIFLVSLIATIS
jgi:hypothetical protein